MMAATAGRTIIMRSGEMFLKSRGRPSRTFSMYSSRLSSSLKVSPPTPPPLCNTLLDTIGNTPLVRLDRFCAALGLQKYQKPCSNNGKHPPTILAKLENTNPGMSKKDRIAYSIIQQAKESGLLAEGQCVVELTSGNTGTGLAIVCSILGHPFCAVMSEGNSIERAQIMRFLGAEVILVPQAIGNDGSNNNKKGRGVSGEDLALVEQAAQQIVQERKAFRVDQFHRQANVDAHYDGTAVEILEQVAANNNNHSDNSSVPSLQIDGFVDFVGTGGSFAGCARRFKEVLGKEQVCCHIVEPASITPLANRFGGATATASPTNDNSKNTKTHVIQGGGYDMDDLTLLDHVIEHDYIDGFLQVTNQQATDMARLLARTEGIFGGFSAGGNLHAAAELIREGKATTVVALICDSGSKYYSANLLPANIDDDDDDDSDD